MIGSALDGLLHLGRASAPAGARMLDTRAGMICVRDSGGAGPVLLMTPDGPNVTAHHEQVTALLAPHARVICFDMPGFGWSRPRMDYAHTLDQGAAAVLAVMDALDVREASLLFSCANGFYAIAAARAAPQRIRHLLLCQTPGLSAMPAWTKRNVPWPVQTPVLGQLLIRATRRKVAHGWYGAAEPDRERRAHFRAGADHALTHGACYCLAGVVQGLGRAVEAELTGVKTPATLLWGDADRSHKHTRAESMLELLPQAQITHLPECGHFPDLEQPQRYAQTVLASIG